LVLWNFVKKTDFILEQVRLCLARKDYTRALIISRKINVKFFSDVEQQDLKLRYYELTIRYAMHKELYLDVCKYYMQVYDTPSVKEDESKWKEVLENAVDFAALAPYDNEQSDLVHRMYVDPNLDKLPMQKELLRNFTSDEIMRWPKVEEYYGKTLHGSPIFNPFTTGGVKRWQELHKRVIEHNIRIISKYYTRIHLSRLAALLDLNVAESEETLSSLVVSGTIYARIDRPAGIVSFKKLRSEREMLNTWSHDVGQLLDLVDTVGHLINKEEMVHRIAKTK